MFTDNVIKPKVSDALKFIKEKHKLIPEKTVLLIAGDCMINYKGRARSLLDWGERIIIIKEDGNVIVHRPELREPVNWQPAGSKTDFKVEKKYLVMRSSHSKSKPAEKMKIQFRSIKFITVTKLKDNAELVVSGMEVDFVNHIMSEPDCIEDGFRIMKREKQVKSGMIDLYGFDKNHTPVVIEVKRSLATISAVHQLRMYVNDIKGESDETKVRGILCAPRVPDMIKHLLTDYNLEWQEVERKIVIPDDFQKTLKDY